MKDIDFDELDKAVNSLMATAQPDVPDAASASEPSEITVSIPAAPPAAPPVAEPITVTQPTPMPARPVAPAARRSGRFMDMVHTSSDMKPRDPSTATKSREGLAITPRTEAVEPIAMPVEAPLPTVEAIPTAMPDPIDLLQDSQSGVDTVEAESAIAPAEPATEPAPLAPIESPFLSDAKVEKRPLNAGSADPTDLGLDMDTLQDEPVASAPEVPATDAEKGDEPPVTPQVPELSSDLVAIESNEGVEVTQAIETSAAMAQVEVPSTPLGAASIAQQYTTQASTGDQSHAAIYDASQYPEPVAHPAKQKSGWLWVLWVALLLGVGAGGAVLLYNFGIIP